MGCKLEFSMTTRDEAMAPAPKKGFLSIPLQSQGKKSKSPARQPCEVIRIKFFLMLLRPPGMLRPFPAISVAAFLFSGLPPCTPQAAFDSIHRV
jgi:hypothetical protein